MLSLKARKRKKVISFFMRLVTLIKPGDLSLFQIKIIRNLVSIASHRRSRVTNNTIQKIKIDKTAEILTNKLVIISEKYLISDFPRKPIIAPINGRKITAYSIYPFIP